MGVKIRRDDTVLVLAGKDRGKQGKVRSVYPKDHRVLVTGVNIVKRHTRARPGVRQTGIVEKEAPIHISNLMLVCPKCDRPTRVAYQFLPDGNKSRACKKCGELIGATR
ncbi:MAG: 50S ribosomal protein L24 [Chloroflexi bacterium]|nr:50S ribosomal protein L24 [Chloroflexota bacterium]